MFQLIDLFQPQSDLIETINHIPQVKHQEMEEEKTELNPNIIHKHQNQEQPEDQFILISTDEMIEERNGH